MKFGGASVATPRHFSVIADRILEQKKVYHRVVVVVSAMGNTTDQLISLAKEVNPSPPRREYDMLVTVGERISISLLAMALARKGHEAISFTGSQSGIITSSHHSEAKILDVRPHRVIASLDLGKVVIVAGFQGVSINKEITTLGRGGSDTTAVALGIALQAEKVEFYKDVPGIFSTDPKRDAQAAFYPLLSYCDAFRVLASGAEILHPRCLFLAKKYHVPLVVRGYAPCHPAQAEGTRIHDEDFSPFSIEKGSLPYEGESTSCAASQYIHIQTQELDLGNSKAPAIERSQEAQY
ncbi:MAG: aspartate kinase [Waddliaceae bacterium]